MKLATAPSSDQGKRAPASRPIRQLSAVMPVYNEEKVLPQSLAEAVGALQQLCEVWEVIIIDDGSTDSTPLILTGLAAVLLQRLTEAPQARPVAHFVLDTPEDLVFGDFPRLLVTGGNVGLLNFLKPVFFRLCRAGGQPQPLKGCRPRTYHFTSLRQEA